MNPIVKLALNALLSYIEKNPAVMDELVQMAIGAIVSSIRAAQQPAA